MRILLVQPNLYPLEFSSQSFTIARRGFPLNLAILAAFIRKYKYDVKIIDAFSEAFTLEEVETIVKDYGPSVVGITSPMHTCLGHEIMRVCKTVNPEIKTVLGGVAPTYMCREIMENIPELDFIIRGEGEIPFLKLLNALEGEESLASVKGLVYRINKKICVSNEMERIEDLDTIPFSAKDIFMARKGYLYFVNNKRYVSIEASRGCPYTCQFCIIGDHFGSGVRYHSIHYVVDEMQRAVTDQSIQYFKFVDSTFTANREYTYALLDEIMRRNLHRRMQFGISTRVDCIDAALLKTLKKAGCDVIVYGIESPTQQTLDCFNKGIILKEVLDKCVLTKKSGIKIRGYLIFNQYEFLEKTKYWNEVSKIVGLLRMIKPHMLAMSPLVTYPAAPLYSNLLERGAIAQSGYKHIFDGKYIPSNFLSSDEIEDMILRVYKEVFWKIKAQITLRNAVYSIIQFCKKKV